MFENVAEHLDEVIRLADRCPEKYQIPCFEALIRVLAQTNALPPADRQPANDYAESPSSSQSMREPNGITDRLPQSNGPANGRGAVFLGQHEISSENITRVFHLDGDTYRIIVKDLQEKTNSKKQIKLALLLGVGGLLAGGQPSFSKERLIEVCREYGAYDGPNFAAHMKKQRDLFIAQGSGWSLTVPAQQRAAQAIKELAS
ncbi:MAG: hypothetical protein O2913_04035 [Chloroflexi bacterium]|nr:hypothetical protein [Chloroflexota bacterium]